MGWSLYDEELEAWRLFAAGISLGPVDALGDDDDSAPGDDDDSAAGDDDDSAAPAALGIPEECLPPPGDDDDSAGDDDDSAGDDDDSA